MSRKVIDVSKWNGNIDWSIVKNYVEGVIIRVGLRGYGNGTLSTDPKFKASIDACVKYSIPVGVYWFAQDITEYEAIESANYVYNLIKGYKLSYPVYYDVELSGAQNGNIGRADNLSQSQRTKCTIAFCKRI